MADINALLRPRSIAVIGASNDEYKLGGRLLATLKKRSFPGRLVPINRRSAVVQDLPALPDLDSLDEPVDLALVIVPADQVLATLARVAERGIGAAIVFSSGFAEADAAGPGAAADRQRAIAELATERGLIVSGPNAEGFFNSRASIAATFSPTMTFEDGADQRAERSVSVIAQSGGVGFSIFNRGLAKGIGFNFVISTGNEAALDAIDFLAAMVEDPDNRVVCLFLEAVRDGDKFRRVLRRAAARNCAVVIAKVGRSDAGRRAAASHTASLAGSSEAFRALARWHGVIEVDEPDDMADVAAALAYQPRPRGRRVGIVTTSGGTGVWLADACTAAGLSVPRLSPDTEAEIARAIPYYASAVNPVDITAGAVRSGGLYHAIEVLGASAEVDMVLIAGPMASEPFVREAREHLARLAAASAKPILYFAYSLPSPVCIALLAEVGVHCSTTLRGAALSLGALARQAEPARIEPPAGPVPATPDFDTDAPVVPEHRAAALLAPHGLAFAPARLVQDADAAVAAARELGGPVALKGQSPDVSHKAAAGLVRLQLEGETRIRNAIAKLLEQRPADAGWDGVLVQAMAAPGFEMIVGARCDPVYGPLVLVGRGGIAVEDAPDTALAPAPIAAEEARRLVSSLRCGGRFDGPAALDAAALCAAIVTLSRLIAAWRDAVREIDLNPVIVYPEGQGVAIVDGLIVRADATAPAR